MLDEKIDRPLVAASEKIAEQSQVLAQDPVSTMLRSVVTTVSADFDPARYAAACMHAASSVTAVRPTSGSLAQHGRRSSIESAAARLLNLSTHLFRKVRHSEARCPVPIQGKCACIFPDDWICG